MSKKFSIKLDTVELVKDFVTLTSRIDGDVMIKSDRWIINGKSIMGIFSLDLSKDLDCEIEASEEQVKIFEEGLRKLNLV